jgi:hypothetical protein
MTWQIERKRCHPRLVNVLAMKHQLEVKFQPCSILPFHRDESPWPVVTVLLPRPILATAWKAGHGSTDRLIGRVARANLVGVHYHHVPCVPLQPIDGGTETTGTMRLMAHRVVVLPLDTTEPATFARSKMGLYLGRATQQIQTTFSPQTIPRC